MRVPVEEQADLRPQPAHPAGQRAGRSTARGTSTRTARSWRGHAERRLARVPARRPRRRVPRRTRAALRRRVPEPAHGAAEFRFARSPPPDGRGSRSPRVNGRRVRDLGWRETPAGRARSRGTDAAKRAKYPWRGLACASRKHWGGLLTVLRAHSLTRRESRCLARGRSHHLSWRLHARPPVLVLVLPWLRFRLAKPGARLGLIASPTRRTPQPMPRGVGLFEKHRIWDHSYDARPAESRNARSDRQRRHDACA